MIFLTVGTQLPFDRFVEAVDTWAAKHPEIEIFGQIGEGDYQPKHIKYCAFLDEQAYKQEFDKASVVLAHAAMGSIITSLIESKPVVVFPRRASLGEHRNEHQLATCRNFEQLDGCYVTYDVEQLYKTLDDVSSLKAGSLGQFANTDLMDSIESFILSDS